MFKGPSPVEIFQYQSLELFEMENVELEERKNSWKQTTKIASTLLHLHV